MPADAEAIEDAEFIDKFESQTLDPTDFNHAGHLRLAWLYLRRYDLETAIALISRGITAYADSLGAADKYHVTITDAMMRIVSARMQGAQDKNWRSFLHRNADLAEDAVAVLCQYFSRDRLFSDEARLSLLAPDIKPI